MSAHAGAEASRANPASSAVQPLPVLLIGLPLLLLLLETPQLKILLVLLHRIQQALCLLAIDVLRADARVHLVLRPLLGLAAAPVPPTIALIALTFARTAIRATIRAAIPLTLPLPPIPAAILAPAVRA